MIKLTEIAWLGGLLEGEGCFRLNEGKYPCISLGMTNEDTVIKAATLMKSKIYRCGNIWNARTAGVRAIQWMMTLYSLFGKRRRAKIEEIIKVWKENTYRIVGMRTMATCHPDKPVRGFGMCQHCYDKKRRRKTA